MNAKGRDPTKIDPKEYERLIKSTSNANFSMLEQSILEHKEKKLVDSLSNLNRSLNKGTFRDFQGEQRVRGIGKGKKEYERRKNFFDDKKAEIENLRDKKEQLNNRSYAGLTNLGFHSRNGISDM